MPRSRPSRPLSRALVLLTTLGLAGALAVPAAQAAPTPVVVKVVGAQTYGSGAPIFAGSTTVPGLTVTGMTCTALTSGAAIGPALAFGAGYVIDAGTCTGGTLSNPNYTISGYTGGSFTVYRAALTVTADDQTRGYGAANPTLTYHLAGFQNGEDASVVTGTPTLSTTATASSNAGTYPISVAAGTLRAANYYFAFTPGTLTIAKATLTVSVAGAQTYGSSAPVFAGTSSVKGVTVSGIICTGLSDGSTVGATTAVGAYTLDGSTCSGGTPSSGNYAVSSYTGSTFTVYRAALTVTADDQTRSYGTANPPLTYSVSGFANGDDASAVSGTAALSTTATASSNAGSYSITAAQGSLRAANYYFVFAPGTLTVAPAPVTVSVAGAQTYGSSAPVFAGTSSVKGVTVSGITCTGLSDGSTVGATTAVGAYTLDGSTCSGGTPSSGNYAVSSYTGSTFTVYRAALTVTADDQTRSYGAANPSLTYAINGYQNGDDSSVVSGVPTVSTTASASSDAGSYPISISPGTLRAANYYFVFAPGTLSVTPAPVTVKVAGAQTYASSAPIFAASTTVPKLTVSGVSCTALSDGTPVTAALAVGAGYTLDGTSCSGGTLSSGNYAIAGYTGSTFTVYRAALTVTADNQTRSYGAANPPLTYAINGYQNGDDSSVVSGSPTLSTIATTTSNVGSYPISISPGTLRAANYYFVFAPGTLSVTPAPVTVKVAGAQTYASSAPIFAASTTVPKLTVSGVSCTALSDGTPIDATLAAGAGYTLDGASCSGGTLSSGNYAIAGYTGSTFTVYRAALTVTADDQTRAYGATNPALTYRVTGFQNGDTASVVSGSPALSTTASASSAVGSYPISAAQGTLRAANYYFTFAPGTLTVTKATLTVRADDKTRAYGAANPALTYTFTGFQNGDTASAVSGSPVLAVAASATADPGSYPISIGPGTLSAGNYTFTVVAGTLTVTQAQPTMTTTTAVLSPIKATLGYGTPSTPVVGVTVVFTLRTTGALLCTVTTDADGTATCKPPGLQSANVALYGYTATFAGTADFAPVSSTQK